MLGIDLAIWLALLLSLGSALLCAVYGLARWNLDDDPGPRVGEAAPGRAGQDVRSRDPEEA